MPRIQLSEDIWYTIVNEDGYAIATTNDKNEVDQYLRDGFEVAEMTEKFDSSPHIV